ncbi:MAG: hypothetical protein A2128_01985 [Candidatus Liptonbacteria bacterium GWC1_60_9]|uniref:Uncharacterized protein n=1 Tax=Candidatus Liptonbacteria bacterium GWC1_60_9 TaxID=1798645 RepID=A0A1G2C5W5_9BACT|nr:MAG: hypothetical protein A2128_01985 [Candidatus Liptonbacteria bacterium GWC1_60_9]
MELSEILPTTARRNELMASLPKVTQGEWEKILELETVRNVVAWLEGECTHVNQPFIHRVMRRECIDYCWADLKTALGVEVNDATE